MESVKISARDLCAGYTSPVVSGVSFDVAGGSILTLMGPNGSGKSTVLKTLACSIKPLGGSVELLGRSAERYSAGERAKLMAVMLTDGINAPLMTCREVVETGRYPYTGYFGKLGERDIKAVDEVVIAHTLDKEVALNLYHL